MSHAGMRLLMTVDAVGGVWQYALDLARALGGCGVETVLALLGPSPDAAHLTEARAIPGVTLIETGLPLDWLCDGPEPVRAAGRAIAALARDTRADVVQLNTPTLAVADVSVPTVAVTHGCVSTWWEAAKPGEALARDYAWHRDLMAEGLRRADHLVAPSVSYAGTVARHYSLPRVPRVVHNGRTPLAATSLVPPAARTLTVGRLWDRVKRADLLDEVAARLSVPFDAAGAIEGPHGERADLRHLGLLGKIDEAALGARLAARPVFVSAASFEPFGLAVLEAASAGCALVLSDIPTFRELWDGAATFIGGDGAAPYGDAIEALLADPAERARLGDAARRQAARYTPAAMAEGMLAIYTAALAATAGKVAA